MSFPLQVVLEVFAILLIAQGYKHENDLIELEAVLSQFMRKKLFGGKNYAKH